MTNSSQKSSGIMRAVVGLSALALGSAISAPAGAPTNMMAAASLNKTDTKGGSCGVGGVCADPGASVIDAKAARAMAKVEVDTDGTMHATEVDTTSTISTSTIRIVNRAALSPLNQAMAQINDRDDVSSIIDENGIDISPQAKAKQWLSRNFDMDIIRHKTMSHSAAIAERYALAVFFYSLKGEQWENSLDFMSDDDVCSWKGMVSTGFYKEDYASINFVEDNDEEDENDDEDDEEDLLLEMGDVDDDQSHVEAGVFCNGSGSVVSLSIPNFIGMSGSLPAELDLLVNLRTLDLQQQPIEGNLPTEISNLVNLQRLSIQDTAISGTIPTELAKLTNLEELELAEDQLWGPIPDEIGDALTKVTTLQLSRNMLTGSIPESFGMMAELETFDISHNQLSGSIPASLFYFMTQVRTLDFSNNEFAGEIPAAIRHISNMDITNLIVNLSHNRLSGNIPREIGEMNQSLEQLYLHDNELDGNIPAEIGNLRDNLMTFHVQNNKLSGVVPLEMADMPWLFYVDVSGNDLVGSLDGMLCDNRDESGFIMDMYNFKADCGEGEDNLPEIICTCCQICCIDGENCGDDDEYMIYWE